MKKRLAAMVLTGVVGSIAVGVQAPTQAEGVHHFNPYYYVTYQHHHKVWVDVSGDGWKSKQDAIRQSKKLIRFAEKYYSNCH